MIATQMASRAFQAYGEYQQAKTDQRVAEQNAAILRQNAGQVGRETSAAEEARRRQIRKEMGDAFTAYAQSGAGADQNLLRQAGAEAELDALNMRYDGQTRRQALLSEAAGQDYQVKVARSRARGAIVSGIVGTAAAGLTARAQARSIAAQEDLLRTRREEAGRRGPSMPQRPSTTKTTGPRNPMADSRGLLSRKGY